jgi:hypothetical protein
MKFNIFEVFVLFNYVLLMILSFINPTSLGMFGGWFCTTALFILLKVKEDYNEM